MITVGQTRMVMQDPDGQLDQLVDRWHSVDMLRLFGDPASVYVRRGRNLLFPNYPDLPAPRINTVVVPSGATRWTYGLFLTDDAGKDAILAEAASNDNVLPVEFSSINPWHPSTSPDGKQLQPLKLWLSPMQPRPLSPRQTNQSTTAVSGLWLIPMVDDRYWWQFRNAGDMESAAVTDAQSLLDHLNEKLGQTIELPCLHPGYNAAPDIANGNQYENAAVVLESLAWHIGCQLVPDLTNTNVRGEDVDGQGYVLTTAEAADHIYSENLAGRIGIQPCARDSDDVPTFEPGHEWVGQPSILMGGEFGDAGRGIPESVLIPDDGAGFSRTSGELGIDRDVAPNTTAVLRLKYDVDLTDGLGEQAIRDFYGRFASQYDYTFGGVQKWQLSAFDDCLIVSQQRQQEGYQPQTRVKSWYGNILPESPASVAIGEEDPNPNPQPTGPCGDCTNCLDPDGDNSNEECANLTGSIPLSWFLVNEDTSCCIDSLNDINVELIHVADCTWESEERECKERFIEESWLTDGASPDVDEAIFYKWSLVVDANWATLTQQFYRKT